MAKLVSLAAETASGGEEVGGQRYRPVLAD
jgi:hypothetical protein